MIRYCLYDFCEYQFEVKDVAKDVYMPCPKCGAATATFETTTTKTNSRKLTQKEQENILQATYHKYSKCPHSFECMGYDNYKPECEKKIMKIECLTPLHHKHDILLDRLDEILNILNQDNQ